jgi:hypothetical protein
MTVQMFCSLTYFNKNFGNHLSSSRHGESLQAMWPIQVHCFEHINLDYFCTVFLDGHTPSELAMTAGMFLFYLKLLNA